MQPVCSEISLIQWRISVWPRHLCRLYRVRPAGNAVLLACRTVVATVEEYA